MIHTSSEGDDFHQLLPGSDVLSDFDRAVANHSSDRSDNLGVYQVELCLIEIGVLALGFGLRRGCTGTYHLHLFGSRLGIAKVGLGLRQLSLRLSNFRLSGIGHRPSGLNGGGTGRGCGYCLIVLLLRDFLFITSCL